MRWLAAWWRQITGAATSDPWQDDPHIRAERDGQHTRINKATPGYLRQSLEEQEARMKIIDKESNPRGIGRDA